MRGVVLHAPGDIRVEDRAAPTVEAPLVHFTSDQRRMGTLASPRWLAAAAWAVAAIIIVLNVKLLADLAGITGG